MKMFEYDTDMHWTEHYAEHGFCAIRGAVPRAFCDRGIELFGRLWETDLPPNEWNADTIDPALFGRVASCVGDRQSPELRAYIEDLYHLPEFNGLLSELFGPTDEWNGECHAQPFVSLHTQGSEAELHEHGHVDFVNVRIPVFGDGVLFQVSLVESDPLSGNLSVNPGWHKPLQKILVENEGFRFHKQSDEAWQALFPEPEVWEFVVKPGDVALVHHLTGHTGNGNGATSRRPRVVLHGLASQKHWPNSIDPDDPNLSPWQRSFAHNGKIDLGYDERARQAEKPEKGK